MKQRECKDILGVFLKQDAILIGLFVKKLMFHATKNATIQ